MADPAADLGDLLPGFLEELGDYELIAGALGVMEEAEAPLSRAQEAAEAPGAGEKRAPMQNSTRRRQKQELAYLRGRVAELEQELAGLKQQLMRSSSGGGEEQQGGEVRAARSWEKIAKRQLVEKQKAEVRNLKLREMLESQIKVARSLEKVLKKRPNAMDSLDALDADPSEGWTKRLRSFDSNEDELYESLLGKTDEVYAELGDVCARHPSMRVFAETNDSEVHLSERNRLYMEVTSSKIVPFDLQATSRAVWRCLSLNRVKLADGTYYKVDGSDDTVAAKAVMQLRISDTLALMRMRFVMKKFEEEGRVVLACVSASESEGPRDVLHGLRMMERVWVVIRPADNVEDDSSCSTIVQLCMRMTPTISSDLGPRDQPPPDHAGALTDLILSALHRNLGWLFQTVENILMEEAVSQP